MSMFWLFGLGEGEGVRVNPNIVRIVMHIGIYGRSLNIVGGNTNSAMLH